MNAPLYRKFELLFWDIAIDLLTRSTWLRGLIREGGEFIQSPQRMCSLIWVFLSGAFGFFAGFSIPHLMHILR
ncbi:MAG: hypothetical protein AB1453_15685 [Chloroflexota bacterium]